MRIRHTLAAAAIGAALSIGAIAVPANAATTAVATTAHSIAVSATADQAVSAVSPQSAYHFWASYYNISDCTVAGLQVIESNPDRYLKAKCDLGSNGKYNLYILI